MLQSTQTLADLASHGRSLVAPQLMAKGSVGGKLLELVADLALRGISRYVAQQAGNLFAPPATKPPQSEQP
jgi:hypothetical protein